MVFRRMFVMAKNNKHELSIKSKLLFNSLDTQNKVVLDLTQKDEKRIKALNTIFQTYQMTLKPFIEDESQEYQEKVYTAVIIAHKRGKHKFLWNFFAIFYGNLRLRDCI